MPPTRSPSPIPAKIVDAEKRAFEAWLHGVLLPFLDRASDRRGLRSLHASGAFERALVHRAARRMFEAA